MVHSGNVDIQGKGMCQMYRIRSYLKYSAIPGLFASFSGSKSTVLQDLYQTDHSPRRVYT